MELLHIILFVLFLFLPIHSVYGKHIFLDRSGHNIGRTRDIKSDGSHSTRHRTRTKRSNHDHHILAYLRGKIYTVDTADANWHTRPKQAMVIKDGVIHFVGNNSMAEEMIHYYYEESPNNNFKIYHLNDAVILPGIHDIHIHPLEAGSEVGGTCDLPLDTPPSDMVDIIQRCAPNQIGTDWVLGYGYSITSFLDYIDKGGISPRKILDSVLPDTPAVMMEETSHSVWVNSEALFRANVTNTTAPRPAGIIMREHNSAEPNGMLFENEVLMIMDEAMRPTSTLDEYNYDGLLYSLGKLAENGITSICDARLFTKRNHQQAWTTACNEGSLNVRAILGIWASPSEDDDTQIQALKDMYLEDSENCTLRRTQIKLYSDGIAQSTTAAMLEPYLINISLPGLEENIGMNYFDQTRLEKYLAALQTFGTDKHFDFNIHAIGDRGIHECLNAINATLQDGTRHRITHVEVLDPADVSRFADLDVIADFQVAGEFSLPRFKPGLEELVGKDRAHLFIPVKSVMDAGGFTTFSSDWDVSTMNPFVGIQHATQRDNESVSVKTAIEMYTIKPAYAMRQEDVVGSLIVGKEADFVVIDQDILTIANTKIGETKVLQTVLQGDSTYDRVGHESSFKDVTSDYMNIFCVNKRKCVYDQDASTGSHLCVSYKIILGAIIVVSYTLNSLMPFLMQ